MRTNKENCIKKHFSVKSKITKIMVAAMSVLLAWGLMAAINSNTAYAATEPAVSADSAIVMSSSTGEEIYEFHSERKLPMGDITKIMTAIVVLDNMHDNNELENKVQIPAAAISSGSIFKANDTVTVRDLLYAMLMTNSNDAATALAIYSSKSVSTFTAQMNSMARELGLVDTNYVNPTGAYHLKQYSTTKDTAVIMQKAFRYSLIQDISKTATKPITVNGKANALVLSNKNDMLPGTSGSTTKYGGMYGGIVGNLNKPKTASVYSGIASMDDMSLVVVLLGEVPSKRVTDATALLNYGFTKVTRKIIFKSDKEVGKVKVQGGEKTRVKVYTAGKGFVYIPPEGSDSLVKTKVVIDKKLKAPVKAGTKAGEYRIYVADELKGSVDLIVKENIKTGWFPSKIYISNLATIIICVIIGLLFLIILRIKQIQYRNRKRKERLRKEKILEIAREQREIEEDRKRRNWTYK